MDLIQVKIKPDNHMISYISAIRKFDRSLSMSQIKQHIETDSFAMEFDLEYYDVVEDLNDIDRKQVFRQLISQLLDLGASLELYHNEEATTLEQLDNWLRTLQNISQDMERESDRQSKDED